MKIIKPDEVHFLVNVAVDSAGVIWQFHGLFACSTWSGECSLLKEHLFLPALTEALRPNAWLNAPSGTYENALKHEVQEVEEADLSRFLDLHQRPAYQLRMLLGLRNQGARVLEEIPLHARSVWRLPEWSLNVFAFSGEKRVSRLSAPEVREVLVLIDHQAIEHQKSNTDLQKIVEERTGPDRAQFLLNTSVLLPSAGMPNGDHDAMKSEKTDGI